MQQIDKQSFCILLDFGLFIQLRYKYPLRLSFYDNADHGAHGLFDFNSQHEYQHNLSFCENREVGDH